MAGESKTNEYILSMGTVMVGPSANAMDLNPADHSIGLVKQVQFTADPQFTELTQGIDEQIVCSVNTRNQVRVSAEVYEFTAKNIAYANGLDAAGTDYDPDANTFTLGADVAADAATFDVGAGEGANLAVGDYLAIQAGEGSDNVWITKVGSVATDTVTIATGFKPSAAFTAAASKVYKVHDIKVGGERTDVTLGVKVVGLMAKDKSPVTMVFPKVKITNGLGLSLTNSDFSNMPFEFTPYSLLSTDPYYSDIGARSAVIFKK